MSTVILDTLNDRLCQTCGYNLRGLTTNRCPECGKFFDPNQPIEARIPWVRRAAIGKWRAYWQTVWMAMFHPIRLGCEVWDAPRVDPKAALYFRWITVAQTVLSYFAMSIGIWWIDAPRQSITEFLDFFSIDLAVGVTFGLFLLIATDVAHAAWFGMVTAGDGMWRRALGHYACAPLVLSPLVGLVIVVGGRADLPNEVTLVLPPLLMLGWWWLDSILVLYPIRRSVMSSLGQAFLLPIAWFLIAFTAVPVGVGIGMLFSVLDNLVLR